MIAPRSASYPVTGAALAAGIDVGFASRWLWAHRRDVAARAVCTAPELGTRWDLLALWTDGVAIYGKPAMEALGWALDQAWREGRLYAPEWGDPPANCP